MVSFSFIFLKKAQSMGFSDKGKSLMSRKEVRLRWINHIFAQKRHKVYYFLSEGPFTRMFFNLFCVPLEKFCSPFMIHSLYRFCYPSFIWLLLHSSHTRRRPKSFSLPTQFSLAQYPTRNGNWYTTHFRCIYQKIWACKRT